MKNSSLVYGVGYNDVDYVTQVFETIGYVDGKRERRLVWQCPDHADWKNMLKRCYSKWSKQNNPTYIDSYCIDEWLYLSKFKIWKSTQGDVKGKHLDKDIIAIGNKMYGPETCAYVWPATNKFVLDRSNDRGEHPLGVYWNSDAGKFMGRCRNPFTKKTDYLGLFVDPLEAHEAWRKRKHELAQLVAETESDTRVVEALKKRYSVEEWYK